MHIKVTSLTLSVTVLSELGVFRKKEAQAKQFYSRKWRESLTWWLRAGVRHPRVIFLEVTLGKLSHWLELHFPPRCWWFSLHAVSSSCDPADCSLPGSSVKDEVSICVWIYLWAFYFVPNTWKDAQHHSLLEKCKSKPQWGIISRQSAWLLSKSLQAINAGEDVEKREPSYTVGGNAN